MRALPVLALCGLLWWGWESAPRVFYENQGRVWQRLRLEDRDGVCYRLDVFVSEPGSSNVRFYRFRSEQMWKQFEMDSCVIVSTLNYEVTLRSCPKLEPSNIPTSLSTLTMHGKDAHARPSLVGSSARRAPDTGR